MNESENIMYVACCRRHAWSLPLLALLLGAAGSAHAQAQAGPQTEPGAQAAPGSVRDDFPWGQGVPDADRDRAIAIFLEANVLLEDTLFGRAAVKYEEALAIWDHPAFHYNLALARIHLDQPIAAFESLEQAVRYGPEPLSSQERYDHALRYLDLLRNQLAQVEVTCDEPGATVTLDGKPLFTGPGQHRGLVLPGGHQIVASAPGRIPATEQLVLAPGQQAAVALVLHAPERTVTERYMPAWIPWASLGLGAAVLGAGSWVNRRADQKAADFNQAFLDKCPRGCERVEAPELYTRLDDAQSERRNALRLYVTGAAAVTIGAALLYVNRERVVRRNQPEEALSVTPVFAPHAAGVSARIRF